MHYVLGKRAISQFIRSDCQRRLRLDLYATSADRASAKAPEKDNRRPGFALITKAGKTHERRKFAELSEVLPNSIIHGEFTDFNEGEERAFDEMSLLDILGEAKSNKLLAEAEYEVTQPFIEAHNLQSLVNGQFFQSEHSLGFSRVRPDLIQILPASGEVRRAISPDGSIEEVRDESRCGLKVIDIKVSGEASPSHFAELAYYAMTLSAWLLHHGFDDRFIVLADAAVWPGRHHESSIEQRLREEISLHITTRDTSVYLAALSQDLESMPPEVILGRVARVLRYDLREVLTPPDWRSLPWHVDRQCSGCDYLGYRWSTTEDHEAGIETPTDRPDTENQRYCWPMAAATDHPSRIAGLTEGAAGKLIECGLGSVTDISRVTAGNRAFETHQTLRAKRTVLVARGQSLARGTPADIPNRAGTSAVLPRFADIQVFLSADFDVATGLTFAFGGYVGYRVPDGIDPETNRNRGIRRDQRRPFLVREGTIAQEAAALSSWLGYLMQDIWRARNEVLEGYRRTDTEKTDASVQFYVWDRLVFQHFCRLMGRHLELVLQTVALEGGVRVGPFSWLFPADTVMDDPRFAGNPRFNNVSAPLTIVSEIVNTLMAASVPHHYGLVNLANDLDADLRQRDGRPWQFEVHKFYLDPLSDQIPSERGIEVWEERSPFRRQDPQWHQDRMRRVIIDKLRAVEWIVSGLRRRLGDTLSAKAPDLLQVLSPNKPIPGVGLDGQMIYQHARLMHAALKLENDLLMAMPPHEREARFESARVERLLSEAEREACLREIGLTALIPARLVLAFVLREDSREVRAKDGDYLLSFAPEDLLTQVQHDTLAGLKRRYPALEARHPATESDHRTPARAALRAKLLKIDRARRRVVIEISDVLDSMVDLGITDLNFDPDASRFGILDKVVKDFFTPKLLAALTKNKQKASGIRNPPLAIQRPLFQASIANVAPLRAKSTPSVPAETFIWNADIAATSVDSTPAEPSLDWAKRWNAQLTPRQLEAIERSTQRPLAIWWGPPGTGKSATAQALLAGVLGAAASADRCVRIAITAFTWVAIDHVARKIPEILRHFDLADRVRLVRLAAGDEAGTNAPELRPYLLPMNNRASQSLNDLEDVLANRTSIVVVAGTVDQLSKLGRDQNIASLFDFMLIDEASQVDVAHAIVAYTKLAKDAHVTIIGDDLQMAPIHPVEPPKGAEHLVGSIFDFYRNYRGQEIERTMLDRSFRSNREIIDFVKLAGYPDLEASERCSGLRFATEHPMPGTQPAGWPEQLAWTPSLAVILDSDKPLAAIVHGDRYSSQRNQEEADLVAGLVLTLFDSGLMDVDSGNRERLSPEDFFRKGIGVVTPHRAQQAAVFERIALALAGRVDENEIFAAIDTVERFQGQEKIVMIASFGLGDKDQIAAEEEFLFNLNRFNVTASRAKTKFIAIMSRRLVDHLPSDRDALIQSRLIKHFVDGFLRTSTAISIPGFQECHLHTR